MLKKSARPGRRLSLTEQRTKYSELTILSAEESHVACNKPFLFEKLKAALEDLIENKDANENDYVSQNRVSTHDAFQLNGDHVLVGDPLKVSTKGARKQNSKAQGKDGPDITKNGTPKAFDERTERLCGIFMTKGHFRNNCPENPKYVFSFLIISFLKTIIYLNVCGWFTYINVFIRRNMA